MEGQYHHWISAAFRDYGSDPWIFLRELAQNSRDAHATLIRVETGNDEYGNETIVFKDDGGGMTYDHACTYLFRLYASSKDNDQQAAGMYGIGFWTVLRFKPVMVTIESLNKKERWGVSFDSSLASCPAPCKLNSHGTRITLVRKPEYDKPAEFRSAVKNHLSHYCRYLRRNDKNAAPLPIILDDEPINRPLSLPGQLTHHFKKGSLEGVVSLGEKPKVSLYSRGLPVWEGSTLMELSHSIGAQNKNRNFEIGPGLAPVFLLNGNRLSVNFSRRAVLDNRELRKVKKIAEQELSNLVHLYTTMAVPGKRSDMMMDGLKKAGRSVRRSWWKKVLALTLLVIPMEIATLHWFFGGPPKGKDPILRVDNRLYTGATVASGPGAPGLDLSYSPKNLNLHFKIFSADSYNIPSGFTRGIHQNLFSIPGELAGDGKKVTVMLNTKETGKIFLPIPYGYRIRAGTIQLNGENLGGVRQSPADEVTVAIPGKGGVIQYECVKREDPGNLTGTQRTRYTRLPPGMSLPGYITRKLAPLPNLNTFQKVREVLDIIGTYVKYDSSAATAEKYVNAAVSGDWLKQVLTIGHGDCDILNGINVLLLRKLDVPSRLIIGFIGTNGKISSVAHAWTEYFHQGWHIIDASGIIPLDSPVNIPGAEGAVAVEQRFVLIQWGLLAGFLGILALLLVIALSLLKKKKPVKKPEISELDKIRENLARLAIGAMLQPSLWGLESNLWDKRIIPTTRNRHISLRQVLRLSRRRRLFAGHPQNPIVKKTGKSRYPILDIGNSAFRKLIHLLPGVVNLDAVHRLDLRYSEGLPQSDGQRLILTFNRETAAVIPKVPLLMWAPGLPEGSEDFQVVDLTPLYRRPNSEKCPWHRKIVAINPNGKMIEQLGALFSANKPLALFRLLDAVLKITQEPPATQAKYLEQFSSHLLIHLEGRAQSCSR